jgi:hypothetical protein
MLAAVADRIRGGDRSKETPRLMIQVVSRVSSLDPRKQQRKKRNAPDSVSRIRGVLDDSSLTETAA